MVIWFLLAAHGAAIVVLVALAFTGTRIGRGAFAIAAAPPAMAIIGALQWMSGSEITSVSFVWVEELGLDVAFRFDAISAMLTLVVSGIGLGVFVYSAGYFTATSAGLTRFAATLLSFSTAMLGLVWADSIWTLFVFWELTSITSYLLIGFKNADASARTAARRAALITGAGGLVLLAGLVTLADASGTTRLRDLEPVTGTAAGVAAVLVIIAAATKSAQVPFQMWLPGAMSAPTPVSAYLHSATMVKIGVIVVAVLQPALGATPPWTPLALTIGLLSMLWGAIGALRHVDAKLILAWGTISQLGLMISLLAVATPKATFAAISILLAHAVFKAALFMVVGEIDVRTGTRDIRELCGLRSSMPIAFVVAVLSGASMAGVPPLLGFAAKEAGIEAALGLSGFERAILLTVIVAGSVLTVAYTVRLLIGLFGGRTATTTVVAPRRTPMTVVTVTLGLLSVAGFVALDWVTGVVRDASIIVDEKTVVYELLRWPGLTTAFVISIAIVLVGSGLGLALARRAIAPARALGAETVDAMIDATLRSARAITGVVQHGSLPRYMVTFTVVAALATVPFAAEVDLGALEVASSPLQLALGVLILAAAIGVVFVPSRLGAALALGAVGFGVAGLFVLQGAPDLALTQLLVETVIVVGFVVGLGRLSRDFPRVGLLWRRARVILSGFVGIGVAIGLAASASRPTGTPPVKALSEAAVETGGGKNVVNVILTDIRALDTLGEIVVLVVVAVGVISLARAGRDDHEPAEVPA